MRELGLLRLLPLAGLLAACAGGGGSTSGQPLTGTFVDAPVSGLTYDTPTQHGTTTAAGEFRYLPGETVTFRIGQLELGAASASAVLTPLDLTRAANADDPSVVRMAQLLLTLDADDDAGNGIQIDAADSARFARAAKLDEQADLQTLLAGAGVDRTLVDADYARRHVKLSLAALKGRPPTARFTVQHGDAAGGDICASDKETGLTWEIKSSDGLRAARHRFKPTTERGLSNDGTCDPAMAQCVAGDYAEKVNESGYCGFSDWRVPTERELKTLWDPSQYNSSQQLAAIDRQVFTDAEPTFYWSDTMRGVQGFLAVWFDATHKTLPSTTLSKGRYGAVRLVRGPVLPDEPSKDDTPEPSFIALGEAKRPASKGEPGVCVDINLRSIAGDLQKNEMFVLSPAAVTDSANLPVDAAGATRLANASNQAQRCRIAAWRVPEVADLAKLLSVSASSENADLVDPEFKAAFPSFVPTASWWALDKGMMVLIGKDGSVRAPQPGETARVMLFHRVSRPVFVRKTPGAAVRPDAGQFAAWRTSYSRYVPGSATQPDWPAPEIDDSVKAGFQDIGLLPPVPFPAANPYSPEKVALGEKLFSDTRLSRNNKTACISCHDPKAGWSDSKELSEGHIGQLGKRNAMTILNTAYVTELFWDGRAKSLEDQAAGPIANPLEMHQSLGHAVSKIAAAPEYAELFRAAFGDASVTAERMTRAIATFERTIISKDSAFDRFLKGETSALSDDALWGMHLFRTKARCINCHNSPLFSDNRFHSDGLHYYGRELEDLGRYLVTGNPRDVGFFRTPTLRDILYSGNYMHNGLFPMSNTTGVLAMYNAGMVQTLPTGLFKYDPLYPVTSPEIRSLGLNKMEMNALMEFMKAISTEPRQEPAGRAELERR
ncbi:cytochrome c peroxidase [Paludibacterium paludis]|uniref:Methylamine utilization protein MauG n=1 Tax=Paludibacterium paludis TaxID=1225769 RepID=A0A918P5E8_9NEIS|nr:cytochrome c peroxidase [Paludibacterium paludis]GGY21540.1 hypothetical protein GCM10011289_26430 [Paludibacterium paludis]